jgi:uncharacterized protein (DUF488 family)
VGRTGPALLTIGYEGQCLEQYLNQLLQAGVTLLCDVRRNPISRKYGFSHATLSKACEAVGIRYEHVPESGVASEQRRNLETQKDYDALFLVYEPDYLPQQQRAPGCFAHSRSSHRPAGCCAELSLRRAVRVSNWATLNSR